ncbi:MAG: AraC family transcriptional regulator [Lachnospiraceae bacterium]|nr:AraC family transcriptional regulator [Lachnospiraceae bacterium]
MNLSEFQKYKENKIHTDSAFPYNTYLCSIPLDFPSVPLHWHDEVELIVIQKGSGMVKVNFNQYQVSAGSIVIVLPEQIHSIMEIPGMKMEYENILFRCEMLRSGADDFCYHTFLDPLFTGGILIDNHIHPGLCCHSEVSSIIRQMDHLCETRPEGYQLAVKGYLFQFLFTLISNRQGHSLSSSEEKSLEKIKFIVGYVQEHYSEPISITQIAQLCHYSDSHFMKFFRTHMETSFTRYLNDYRLTIAHRLLGSSKNTILEIAQQCGFENLSYFNRLFKRKYGVTPKEVR